MYCRLREDTLFEFWTFAPDIGIPVWVARCVHGVGSTRTAHTILGMVTMRYGDIVVKIDDGELGGVMVYTPDDFAAMYEPASEDDATIETVPDSYAPIEFVRPFENLAELPDDLSEAFEAFKLAILRHKCDTWHHISRDDALAALDALKQLAVAPTTNVEPF